MIRVRISGEIIQKYEQIIELSDEKFQKFRSDLNEAQAQGVQAIDDFLGADYSDVEPLDVQCDFWDVKLVDDKGSVIESLA